MTASAFQVALRPDVVKRSGKVALIVGTILILINYGDRLLGGSIQVIDVCKMLLTYCVPYCVSTYASVSAVMAAAVEQGASLAEEIHVED